MPDNKKVPGGRGMNPRMKASQASTAKGPKSWQEQLAAIKASGVAGASRATAMDVSRAAANATEMAKSLVTRARTLVERGFSGAGTIERVLLIGGMTVGLVAIAYLVGIPQWMKQRKENRQWTVVNNLTPDRLLKRCGKPLSDETRDIYPVIARDIRYEAVPGGAVVLKFSRTAEESSDWVFMSMEDTASGATYDTPIAKITALSCLDSSK
jgi:hypothetical protein